MTAWLLLNHHGTAFCKAVAEVGAFLLPALVVETHASVSDVTFAGLDQVEELRVLFPTHADILTTSVAIACPQPQTCGVPQHLPWPRGPHSHGTLSQRSC